MNTTEIDNYFKYCSRYYGTYPRDILPQYIPNDSGIIINTDKSTQSGEHWVAVYKSTNGIPVYFDSFGLIPTRPEIVKFIKDNTSMGWFYNAINFQSIFSDTCGLYCIYFLTNYFNGGSFETFRAVFNFRPDLNDRLAKMLRTW